MTAIAYRDGILAADQCASAADTTWRTRKLYIERVNYFKDSVTVGITGTGTEAYIIALKKWVIDGEDTDKWPKFQTDAAAEDRSRIIILHPHRGLYWYESQPVRHTLRSPDDYMAWGAGREAALGAMYAGASATLAIAAANHHVTGCNYGVDWFECIESEKPVEHKQ